jgi:hypothetical protein
VTVKKKIRLKWVRSRCLDFNLDSRAKSVELTKKFPRSILRFGSIPVYYASETRVLTLTSKAAHT